jgi:hypothetical protein
MKAKLENIALEVAVRLERAANWFKPAPEIAAAHAAGRAQVEEAKRHLKNTKAAINAAKTVQKAVHIKERELLEMKQFQERKELLENCKAQLADAKGSVKEAKVSAGEKLAQVRKHLQLQALATGNNTEGFLPEGAVA